MNVGLGAKRLELLHELVPQGTRFGLLYNPTVPGATEINGEAQAAAAALGLSLDILTASTSGELDQALASIAEKKIEALVLGASNFFSTRQVQITTFMVRYGLPAIFFNRGFAEIGGLMSYAPDRAEPWRQIGIYVGRILKGEKPAALPVLQPTKFELVINLTTAKLLGIAVPPTLLAVADAVIE
jgi:putative ABC transport system substrate-binding protein